jgi:TetR/AcrR family transcriptional regulator
MARDPEATRQRILDAAFDEFAAHGLAGARVDRIVNAAGVNKRMLYHYFGNKEALFLEVLRGALDEMGRVPARGADTYAEALAYWTRALAEDSFWFRLLQWQALETEPDSAGDEAVRREAWKPTIDRLRARQQSGEIDPDFDTEQLMLTGLGLVFFPAAFPQLTRIITGTDPSSPEFVERRVRFLDMLALALRPRGPEDDE